MTVKELRDDLGKIIDSGLGDYEVISECYSAIDAIFIVDNKNKRIVF